MKKILFDKRKNVIAAQLRRLRLARGLSQEQLAARLQTLGVSIDQQMVSKIERNDRIVTDYELACLCEILAVSPETLLQDFYKKS